MVTVMFLCDYETQSKIVIQQGITQFLQFLEPETGQAFSFDTALEF